MVGEGRVVAIFKIICVLQIVVLSYLILGTIHNTWIRLFI